MTPYSNLVLRACPLKNGWGFYRAGSTYLSKPYVGVSGISATEMACTFTSNAVPV